MTKQLANCVRLKQEIGRVNDVVAVKEQRSLHCVANLNILCLLYGPHKCIVITIWLI